MLQFLSRNIIFLLCIIVFVKILQRNFLLWQSCNITEYMDYLADHPEIKQLIADYVLTLLIGSHIIHRINLVFNLLRHGIVNWSFHYRLLISEACRNHRLYDTTLQSVCQGTESLGRRLVCGTIWHWHTSTFEDPIWDCVPRSQSLRKVPICITIWRIILRATWITFLKRNAESFVYDN